MEAVGNRFLHLFVRNLQQSLIGGVQSLPTGLAQSVDDSWEVVCTGIKNLVLEAQVIDFVCGHLLETLDELRVYGSPLETGNERTETLECRNFDPFMRVLNETQHYFR